MPNRSKAPGPRKARPETIAQRILRELEGGPRTVMELAIRLYGSREKPYRTPELAGLPPKVVCADVSGYGRVSCVLAKLLREGAITRPCAALYALPGQGAE